MATLPQQPGQLDIREQVARIDKHLAEIDKLRVDTKHAPWQFLVGGFTAAAAVMGATAAAVKIFF